MNRTIRWCAAATLAIALMTAASACGSNDETSTGSTTPPTTSGTTAPATPEVAVEDPWARTSPMATTFGAVYMTLTSNVGDTLMKASVPTSVAGTTEIHETVMASTTGTSMAGGTEETMAPTTMAGSMGTDTTMGGSGEMEMRPIDELALPAGEAVALAPGGYHIMLIDLVAPLAAGSTIEVTLTFEKAGEQVVTATVRDS